jgi:hypothetical protein
MAFSGVHVACGFAASKDFKDDSGSNIAILGAPLWSQTMASAGTTQKAVPSVALERKSPIISVDTSIDIFFAIGPDADATAGPRRFLRAGGHFDGYAKNGDKLAWIAA